MIGAGSARRRYATALSRGRGAAFLSVAATGLVTQAITAVSGPLVARMLGPAGRGEMVMVTVVALVSSQIAAGGLPMAIAHTVASADQPALDVLRGRLRRWFVLAAVPGIAAAAVVLVLLRHTASSGLGPAGLGFAITTILIWQMLLAAMVQGEGHVVRNNVFRLAGLSLYAVSMLVMFIVVPSREPLVLLAVYGACVCLGLLVGRAMLRPASGAEAPPDAADDLDAFARKSYMSGVGLLDGLGLDLLLVGAVLGQARLGLYQVALSATNLPGVMLTGVGQVLLPRLAAAPTPEAARALVRRWVSASVAAAVVLVLAMEAIIGPLMRFAFGPEFFGVVGCARVLIPTWGLLGLRRVLTAVAQAQGHAGLASRFELICLGLLVVGVLVFGTLGGVVGAAYGLAVAALAGCLMLIVTITWHPAERAPAGSPTPEGDRP